MSNSQQHNLHKILLQNKLQASFNYMEMLAVYAILRAV